MLRHSRCRWASETRGVCREPRPQAGTPTSHSRLNIKGPRCDARVLTAEGEAAALPTLSPHLETQAVHSKQPDHGGERARRATSQGALSHIIFIMIATRPKYTCLAQERR